MKESELTAALDFAAAEAKAAGATTFLLVWETAGALTYRTHPQSVALLRGVVDMLAEEMAPDDDDDDD